MFLKTMIWSLPVRKLHGVGPHTEERLRQIGVRTGVFVICDHFALTVAPEAISKTQYLCGFADLGVSGNTRYFSTYSTVKVYIRCTKRTRQAGNINGWRVYKVYGNPVGNSRRGKLRELAQLKPVEKQKRRGCGKMAAGDFTGIKRAFCRLAVD
ncbi:hypothetical protein [Desulfofundulus salinum]|uniref:Uncharacterized protein n=1 Tax=Desulfofundulus salinus TaxID=2419843 RepID=A0A494WVK2_9FIRM|nr:hypothetical protein D7024_11350 [Desulfofundulus salinum]